MTTERRDEPSGGARTRADGVAHQRRADRDLDLLDALRRREPMAAECLVTRYGERAYRLARRITGNGQGADGAVQDAFWTVVPRSHTCRGGSASGPWLSRIVPSAGCPTRPGRPGGRGELAVDR